MQQEPYLCILILNHSFGTAAFMNGPFAIDWYGYKDNDRTVNGVYSLMFAKNTKEALQALREYDTLAAAFVFATVI